MRATKPLNRRGEEENWLPDKLASLQQRLKPIYNGIVASLRTCLQADQASLDEMSGGL
ncbi:hypothetical protein [Methylobacterium gnaphalii]|uniref:Uncharacterized protein n=1 Tax=Methylobacterium gnaphalii TaxID=1010610 RepID=A0A512JKN7_9HYPH|nr:hypothetical protein [Methylobacterium gnaphalii]GEP10528.1 hypothetical protein MGN01_23730 [Methylobacterium gnaphalii]GJD69244.1 hypothetical protein MMMDOFMJ_2171 [Methylobacterium gnaphalii]GLS47908.1 hypothetical protein GCM10007885_07520 [Methylobacterium gnaphalii]